MPGAKSVPEAPAELVTSTSATECWVTRGRQRVAEDGEAEPCEVCLADVGVEAWTRLWTAALTWLSITTDVDVVKRLCRARIDEAHLRLTLSEDGPFVPGQRGGLVAHPAAAQLRAVNAEMVKLEQLCGFTPSDRGRLGVGEVEGAPSELASLLARRTTPRRSAEVPARTTRRSRAVGADEDEMD